MAFPVAVTEEVWNLGQELSFGRVLLFAFSSLVFLALIVLLLHHDGDLGSDSKVFYQRVLSTYGLTLLISALLLFGVDRLPLFENLGVAFKRTILVAFPASFAATVVDSLGDRA